MGEVVIKMPMSCWSKGVTRTQPSATRQATIKYAITNAKHGGHLQRNVGRGHQTVTCARTRPCRSPPSQPTKDAYDVSQHRT